MSGRGEERREYSPSQRSITSERRTRSGRSTTGITRHEGSPSSTPTNPGPFPWGPPRPASPRTFRNAVPQQITLADLTGERSAEMEQPSVSRPAVQPDQAGIEAESSRLTPSSRSRTRELRPSSESDRDHATTARTTRVRRDAFRSSQPDQAGIEAESSRLTPSSRSRTQELRPSSESDSDHAATARTTRVRSDAFRSSQQPQTAATHSNPLYSRGSIRGGENLQNRSRIREIRPSSESDSEHAATARTTRVRDDASRSSQQPQIPVTRDNPLYSRGST